MMIEIDALTSSSLLVPLTAVGTVEEERLGDKAKDKEQGYCTSQNNPQPTFLELNFRS